MYFRQASLYSMLDWNYSIFLLCQ